MSTANADGERQVPRDTTPPDFRLNAMVLSLVSLCLIVFGVWLVSAGKRYREEYSDSLQGWRVGSTRSVELTLVPTDKENLACAADATVAGLHCAFRGNATPAGGTADDPQVLQPVNTTAGELLLGAGLWTSPDMKGVLPATRFTVVCDYRITGVVRSAAIRFASSAPFSPAGKIVTVGPLTNCILPR